MSVQEMAERGVEPPIRYIRREVDRPIDSPPPSTPPIPVVDISRLSQSDGQDERSKLWSALHSWGLFHAIGHGMSASYLDDVRIIAREFFQLPMEEKMKYPLAEGNDFLQGYGNDQVMTQDQILNWSDRLYLLTKPEDERKLDLWPDNPTSFRDTLHEYTMNTSKVAVDVLRSMAELLDLSEDSLISQFGERAQVFTRFNYYPCCPRPDLVFGLQPHSDGSAFTIVLLDKDVEGLQVLKYGEWVKVPAIPNALLINMGDQMEIMTNGIFKSPVHRVVTNPERERLSVAMFFALELNQELKPVDGLVDEIRPRLYKAMTTKDYLAVYFQSSLKGERAIDWAKI